MKYDNYLNATEHQIYEWIKTGVMSKSAFIQWLSNKIKGECK